MTLDIQAQIYSVQAEVNSRARVADSMNNGLYRKDAQRRLDLMRAVLETLQKVQLEKRWRS